MYEWTKPPLRIPVAERRGLKKSTGTDTLHCTMNGVSSRHRYSLLDVHERDASLTFRCGALSEMTWQHLFSTGRHRTSGEPWASGRERLSGKSGIQKPFFFKLAACSYVLCVCVWCTAGGERRLGGSRSTRSNRDPWGVWRKGKIDSTCLCVCMMSKQCQSSFMFFPQYDKKMSSTKMDCSKVKA